MSPPISPTLRRGKPLVLAADDHSFILDAVSQALATEFDLIEAVTDGRRAVDAALRLDPDLVVLDVSMPELDGFGALQELKRLGSRARAVFLTMHEADEYVAAAIEAGAHGYVLKSRLQPDLASALTHALADRLFVPSLTALLQVPDDRGKHAAQFYPEGDGGLDDLARFVGATLRRGDTVVVAGTDATRTGIATRLKERGVNVAGLMDRGRYLPHDAAEMLSRFMRNGLPDSALLAQCVQELETARHATAAGPQKQLTVVGEMAGLLCQDGNAEGAIRLEQLWGSLTADSPFVTLCGYSQMCFQGEAGLSFLSTVCAQHGSIAHSARTFQ